MVKIAAVCDRVVAKVAATGQFPVDPPGILQSQVRRSDIDAIVIATIRELGFDINTQTGQVYDPAREDDKLSIANMRQQAIYTGMPRKRGAKRPR